MYFKGCRAKIRRQKNIFKGFEPKNKPQKNIKINREINLLKVLNLKLDLEKYFEPKNKRKKYSLKVVNLKLDLKKYFEGFKRKNNSHGFPNKKTEITKNNDPIPRCLSLKFKLV